MGSPSTATLYGEDNLSIMLPNIKKKKTIILVEGREETREGEIKKSKERKFGFMLASKRKLSQVSEHCEVIAKSKI